MAKEEQVSTFRVEYQLEDCEPEFILVKAKNINHVQFEIHKHVVKRLITECFLESEEARSLANTLSILEITKVQ